MNIEEHINNLMRNICKYSSLAETSRNSYNGDIMRAYYAGEMLGYERALELVRMFRSSLFDDLEVAE